ncbi:EAL domain-containing protein [Luteimonas aquatica]|uniref:EAL domain-containing protein n=1 Tax=Luteimonas aquatica TaxID=450364 RepID=UPI001F57F564|nr:EAL domain-containing protein [Luteimonas aquatica]
MSLVEAGQKRWSYRTMAYGLAPAMILGMAVILAFALWNDYRVRYDTGRTHSATLANSILRQVSQLLHDVEHASGVSGRTPELLAELHARHPELQALEVAAAPGEKPVGEEHLYIDPPVRRGAEALWVLPMRMQDDAGRVRLRMWMRADVLQAMVDGTGIGEHGIASIMHADGTMIARSGDAQLGYTGKSMRNARAFSPSYLGMYAATYTGSSPIDGKERIISFRRSPEFQLIAVAGVSYSDLLIDWLGFAVVAGALFAVIACICLLELWRFTRAAAREHGLQQRMTQAAQHLAEMRERARQAEEQYHFLYERHPLPAWVFDKKTLRILEVNEMALERYGYTREEFLRLSILDIRPEEDRAEVAESARREAPHSRHGRIWRHRRKDGTQIYVAVYASDVVFQGQSARLALVLDVTDRVQAETDLARSEERFQLVARATSDAIWDWDLGTNGLWWSDSFYTQFLWSRERIAPTLEGWEALLHPDDIGPTMQSLDKALADGVDEWSGSYRFRRGDGSYATVLDRAIIQRDAAGRAVRAVGGMVDISRQRRDEAELKLLRSAIEAAQDGVVVVDAQNEERPLVYVNPAFERMTGYAEAEVLGRRADFMLGNDNEEELRRLSESLAQGREARALLRGYRKDSQKFWYEVLVSPVYGDEGRITHYVGTFNDVSARQRLEEQLTYRATHDPLTGMPNRQLLLDRLEHAVSVDCRPIAIAFVDIDDFKLINDGLGHGVGDEVLRVVAARLRTAVRAVDTVSRFGGDEFVLLLGRPEGPDDIEAMVQRMHATLTRPLEVQGAVLHITPSIGYCRYPEDGGDQQTLLRRADLAMYQAKSYGRNCVAAYRPEFDQRASQRLELVSQLHEALQFEQFELVFQPQFHRDGAVVGMEALLRWRHPQRGLLEPSAFIRACEDSGLIAPIGRWALREAARHHRLLADRGWGHVRIAVNISAEQFLQNLVDDVVAVVRELELPPGVFELELTESAVMANPQVAIRSMQRIRDSGVLIAVDDFGTGYSSLAYLKQLPLDRLKIDRSFVRDLGHDRGDELICEAIVRLARAIGLSTIAEGVETEAQRQWLIDCGCEEMQGFLFGPPDTFANTLRRLGEPPASGGGVRQGAGRRRP